MKKIIFSLAIFIVIAITTNAAPAHAEDSTVVKKDSSVVVLTMSTGQLNSLILAINENVDSKKLSKELVDFLLATYKYKDLSPADKPKQVAKVKP